MVRIVTLCVLLLSAMAKLAHGQERANDEVLEVLRIAEPLHVDGQLDDRAWREANFVGVFSQRSPEAHGPAPASTQVAVTYDERALYVAFQCDGSPDATLSRRDELVPEADYVMVYVDGALDRRNARLFAVTAAGVQADGTLSFDSPERDHSWNAVWHSAVTRHDDRWSVELSIPLAVLGLSQGEPRIGVHFRRYFGSGAITTERHSVPLTSSTYVSHFEVVGPLVGVSPRRSVELRPFIRFDVRPRVAEGAPLRHDLLRFASGGDLRLGLTGSLGLYLAVLPDFGEAEIDPAVLNLSAYETVNSEQRQLFLEDADLFRFPELTSSWSTRPFQLVHTRRIGAPPPFPELGDGEELVEMDDVAPVEGVVRLAGQAGRSTEVGVLTAMTGPARATIRDAQGRERTIDAMGRRLFAAARLRQALGRSRSTLGGMVTATGELGNNEGGTGEYALAVDLDLKPSRGHHRVIAIGSTSFVEDEFGWGVHLSAGRMGGSGFRWRLITMALSDGFEVNGLGWQRRDDRFGFHGMAGWVFDGLGAPLQQIEVYLFSMAFWNFDGLHTGSLEGIYVSLGHWDRDSMSAEIGVSNPEWDDMETRGGPPLRRPLELWGNISIRTAQARSLGASLTLSGSESDHGRQIGVSGELRWSPVRLFRLTLSGSYTRVADAVLWVDDLDDDNDNSDLVTPLLGHLDLDLIQVSLRSTLAITPTLSLQAYVQMLASAGDYERFMTLEGSELLTATNPEATYDFDEVVFRANVVLRWEVRPGTVLYAVYTHSGEGDGTTGILNIPARLGEAAWSNGSDLFLLKLEMTLY